MHFINMGKNIILYDFYKAQSLRNTILKQSDYFYIETQFYQLPTISLKRQKITHLFVLL